MRAFMIGFLLMSGVAIANAAPYAFPVPFVEHRDAAISFKDLPGEGTIKIFTVDGEEVVTLTIAPGETLKQWNVTNSDGKHLASGVYYYLINAGGTETLDKLVVIR